MCKFGRSRDIDKSKDIDNKIKDLNSGVVTSDDLNMLGDLYIKKGDKKLAIEHFYEAAKGVSNSQNNKAIAIYKKILNISPNDIDACEGIINILSKSGLVAEQTKYLLILARLYQNKGDLKKANSIYRKINELDPTNKAADVFFSRGKVKVLRNNP
jgi:tetratricopeptide (TPR) repeat protein